MRYTELRRRLDEFPNFSIQEIEKYFSNFDSRRLVEWQNKGYIIKLRNRFYYFSDQKVDELFLYYSANELYKPSYISLESAFSRYNFIPEGVYQTISCTTLKTNTFETPIGIFYYRHLKPELYFGYQLEEWRGRHCLIAEPEKALIDYLYLHHEVQEIADIEALRWNADEICDKISKEKFNSYVQHIGSPALSKRTHLLTRYLNAHT